MRRPRLTKNVLDGLNSLCCHYEAGGCEDLFGLDYDLLDGEGKRDADNVSRACEYVTLLLGWWADTHPEPRPDAEGQLHLVYRCEPCNQVAAADGKGSWLCPGCGSKINEQEA